MKTSQSARMHDEQLLRSLLRSDGLIRSEPLSEDWPAYIRGDKRKRPLFWVNCADVERLLAEGALAKQEKGIGLSGPTRRRLLYGAAPKQLEDRIEYVPGGVKRPVRRNIGGSVVERLARRLNAQDEPMLSAAQLTAAQAYTRALLIAGEGWVSHSAAHTPRVDGTRRHDHAERQALARIDARRGLDGARAALGPDMARLLDAVCGADERLEAIERTERWSRGTGLVVLRMALDILSRHYGTVPGVTAHDPSEQTYPRGWRQTG